MVELSAVMRAQRSPDAAPCVDAQAESLPYADGAFDAAMAVLSDHHWRDRLGGLRELRRVGRRAVLFQWDPAFREEFWLVRDYLPSFARNVGRSFDRVKAALGATREEVVPIPHDCRDGFLMAWWRRPDAYLDATVRANISVFSLLSPAEVDAMVAGLAADLASGAWELRKQELLARDGTTSATAS